MCATTPSRAQSPASPYPPPPPPLPFAATYAVPPTKSATPTAGVQRADYTTATTRQGTAVRRVAAMMQQDGDAPLDAEALLEYQIRLEPPGPELLFRLESEDQLQERIRQEAKQRNIPEQVEFPNKPTLSQTPFQARAFPSLTCQVEPLFVMHRRLYFEDLNHERYGWDLGFIQPLVSLGAFYKDVLLLPHNMASRPHTRYEASAGYCMPGDPVPYLLYPPQVTLPGSLFEAGVWVGLAGIIP